MRRREDDEQEHDRHSQGEEPEAASPAARPDNMGVLAVPNGSRDPARQTGTEIARRPQWLIGRPRGGAPAGGPPSLIVIPTTRVIYSLLALVILLVVLIAVLIGMLLSPPTNRSRIHVRARRRPACYRRVAHPQLRHEAGVRPVRRCRPPQQLPAKQGRRLQPPRPSLPRFGTRDRSQSTPPAKTSTSIPLPSVRMKQESIFPTTSGMRHYMPPGRCYGRALVRQRIAVLRRVRQYRAGSSRRQREVEDRRCHRCSDR
jgi:hypothetical protein